MPFFIPPQMLDVPAIVQPVAHVSGSHGFAGAPIGTFHRPMTPPNVTRPNSGSSGPDVVTSPGKETIRPNSGSSGPDSGSSGPDSGSSVPDGTPATTHG
jgi:hypothetical protein